MLSKLKGQIVDALRRNLGAAWKSRLSALIFPKKGKTVEAAYLEGYKKGYWEGADDAMTIGLDSLQEACEDRQARKDSLAVPAELRV